MKTNFKLLLLFIICSTKILAQNSATILTPNYKITGFANLYPLPIKTNPVSTHPDNGYYAAFVPTKSQNIQVDATGKIMFFIIDGYVFDRKGRTLGQINLDSDGKCGETVIVPSSQNCNNTFFLLTTYTTSGGVIGGYASFDKIQVEYDAYDNLIPGSGLSSELEQAAVPSTYDADNYKIASLVGTLFTDGETSGGGGHGSFPLFAVTKEVSGAKRFVYV